MTAAQLLGYPLVPIAAFELLLGLLLLRQNPRRSRVNWTVAACVLSACIWSLSTSLMYIRVSLGLSYLFFARFSWIGWFTVPTAIQSVLYLEDEQSRKARIAGWVLYPFWTIVLGLCLFTDLIVTDGYIPVPYQNSPGPLEMPLRLIGGMLVFWMFYEILRVRRGTTGTRRSQLGWYLYGTTFFAAGGAVIGGFLQLFTGHGLEPSLSAYFSFPWVLMIFYAISRYRLFDIRLLFSRVAGALLLSLIIAVIQTGLHRLLDPSVGEFASIVISTTAIGLVLFGTPLGRRMQKWVHEIVFREREASRRMLLQAAQAMVSILRLDELLDFIVRRIRDGMGAGSVSICMTGQEGAEALSCSGAGAGRSQENVPKILLTRELQKGKPLVLAELETAADPEAQQAAASLREHSLELVIPLILQGRLLGAFLIGERPSGDPYMETEIELLQAVASQASIAVENARLFEEAGRIRDSLQKSEEKFRILANTLTAAVIIHDGEKLRYVNPVTSLLTGYSVGELLQMDFWSLVHPSHFELVAQRARARLRGDAVPQQYEFKIIKKDGAARWALMNTGLIEFDGRKAVIATLLDITDRKRIESEREQLYEESANQYRVRIEEQQRHLEEKENILKDLHDGVGGLTSNINLLAELARKSDDLNEVRKSLKTIANLSRESLAEIRTFMQSLDTRELDWSAISAELRYLGSTIIESHGMRFTLDASIKAGGSLPTSVMALNLFRIYKESLANIVKHSRANSVAVVLSVEQGQVTLHIQDDGIGMNGKRKTGRGLYNMHARATVLGGKIAVTSEKGTHILLEVPIP